jgi:hypothetical protein
MTGGVYKRDKLENTEYNRYTTSNLPSLTVSPPPSGGTTATVQGVWQDDPYMSGYSKLIGVQITNPGGGYSSDPTVTLSRAADAVPVGGVAQTPNITLSVFSDVIDSDFPGYSNGNLAQDQLFRASSGRVWSLNFPRSFVSYEERSWAFDCTPKKASGETVLVNELVSINSTTVRFIGADKKIYSGTSSINTQGPQPIGDVAIFDGDSWSSLAAVTYFAASNVAEGRVYCGTKTDGSMWSWGDNSGQAGVRGRYVLFGDGSEVGATRSTPAQIAPEAEWVRVQHVGGAFVAIRKDAICREIDQPMEYWPEWYYYG